MPESWHDGKFILRPFKVAGRNIPLSDIRKSTLKSDEQYLRLRTDESLTEDTIDPRLKSLGESREEEKKSYLKHIESQRHWMIWHDHSSMANSGFMLFLIRQLKARATAEEQLRFVSTRHECLREMSQPLQHKGVQANDKMRLMNGDKPAVEFEAGNQKGGHYPSPDCDAHMSMAMDYTYSKYRNHRDLEERRNIVLDGKLGKERSVDPFKKLKKEEVVRELKASKETRKRWTIDLQTFFVESQTSRHY
ncbi:hypothetical protein AC249_AIPGENE6763 [Exaiptasia diaphana]|nr:hypothetical protein AC249_AIPGENE6763 [Exaiptasia diaphana]